VSNNVTGLSGNAGRLSSSALPAGMFLPFLPERGKIQGSAREYGTINAYHI
jgi:hypothetical protein